ncbi:hypothetical protein ColKHC_09028 [Colletotrichum higginsianum]|nr:hypothetical protein ColKHC_09028 [Colletotrichum higginsianum]
MGSAIDEREAGRHAAGYEHVVIAGAVDQERGHGRVRAGLDVGARTNGADAVEVGLRRRVPVGDAAGPGGLVVAVGGSTGREAVDDEGQGLGLPIHVQDHAAARVLEDARVRQGRVGADDAVASQGRIVDALEHVEDEARARGAGYVDGRRPPLVRVVGRAVEAQDGGGGRQAARGRRPGQRQGQHAARGPADGSDAGAVDDDAGGAGGRVEAREDVARPRQRRAHVGHGPVGQRQLRAEAVVDTDGEEAAREQEARLRGADVLARVDDVAAAVDHEGDGPGLGVRRAVGDGPVHVGVDFQVAHLLVHNRLHDRLGAVALGLPGGASAGCGRLGGRRERSDQPHRLGLGRLAVAPLDGREAGGLDDALPVSLVDDGVRAPVLEAPPALERAEHDVEPGHVAGDLEKGQGAVVAQHGPQVPQRRAQVARRMYRVRGQHDVVRRHVLGLGWLLNVQDLEAHLAVAGEVRELGPLGRGADEGGRDVGEDVLEGDAQAAQPLDHDLCRAARAGTDLEDAELAAASVASGSGGFCCQRPLHEVSQHPSWRAEERPPVVHVLEHRLGGRVAKQDLQGVLLARQAGSELGPDGAHELVDGCVRRVEVDDVVKDGLRRGQVQRRSRPRERGGQGGRGSLYEAAVLENAEELPHEPRVAVQRALHPRHRLAGLQGSEVAAEPREGFDDVGEHQPLLLRVRVGPEAERLGVPGQVIVVEPGLAKGIERVAEGGHGRAGDFDGRRLLGWRRRCSRGANVGDTRVSQRSSYCRRVAAVVDVLANIAIPGVASSTAEAQLLVHILGQDVDVGKEEEGGQVNGQAQPRADVVEHLAGHERVNAEIVQRRLAHDLADRSVGDTGQDA